RVLGHEAAEGGEGLGRAAEVEERPALPVEGASPLPALPLELEEGLEPLLQPARLALDPEELEQRLGAEVAARVPRVGGGEALSGPSRLALAPGDPRRVEERIVGVGVLRQLLGEAEPIPRSAGRIDDGGAGRQEVEGTRADLGVLALLG